MSRGYAQQPDDLFSRSGSASLKDLLSRLEVPDQEAKILFVNNRKQNIDYVLRDGDKVGIFPQVAGG